MNLPKISFIIPIFNSELLLEDCLLSIHAQNYPRSRIEIITPDGGSKDQSCAISRKYKCRIIKNKKVLAEPGFMLGAEHSTGDYLVYMGADNRLVEKDWIRKMILPFEDSSIMAAYPRLRNHPQNTFFTKYFNTFTDPINHFVFWNASNPLTFHKEYSIVKTKNEYIVYAFSTMNFPMLAFDQGFMIRKAYNRSKDTEYDDILPVIEMIEDGMQFAYVPQASNFHFTLEKGFSQYSRKMRWIIDNNLAVKDTTFGFPSRKKYLNLKRRLRFIIWPLYAVSIFGPVGVSLFGFIRDKKQEWLFHPFMTWSMATFVLYEYLRVLILKKPSLASRQEVK